MIIPFPQLTAEEKTERDINRQHDELKEQALLIKKQNKEIKKHFNKLLSVEK